MPELSLALTTALAERYRIEREPGAARANGRGPRVVTRVMDFKERV